VRGPAWEAGRWGWPLGAACPVDGRSAAAVPSGIIGRVFEDASVRAVEGGAPPPTGLRPAVSAALEGPPGPDLLAAVTSLAGLELSAREQTEVCLAWTRLVAHCTAGRLDAVAQLDAVLPRPPGRERSLRPAAQELAAALGMSGLAASRLVGLARCVAEDLPAVGDALADGALDPGHVRAVAAVVRDVPSAVHVRALEEVAVDAGRRLSPCQLRGRVEAEAERRMPGWAAERAAAGRQDRDVQLGPSPVPGCRRVTADLPLVAATAVWMGLNGAARSAKAAGDPRTVAQLRADVLTALTTGGISPDGPSSGEPVAVPGPERLAQLAEVHVVVAADTLLGSSDAPADVPGLGALDAEAARDLARDARWRRLLADPAGGALVEHGTTVYRPPVALRRHVVSRDGTCVAPTCSTPARLAQVDHTVAFGEPAPAGAEQPPVGTTDPANSGPLCERDHDAKTHLGWHLVQPRPGEFVWTSPTGRTYAVPARPLLPGWVSDRVDRDARALPGAADGEGAPGPPGAGPPAVRAP
jgi:hypothetical protein